MSTILVVDDESDVRALISTNFKSAGFSVIEAADGPAALAKVRADPPDAIVLDLMLPQMSGLEICKILKGNAVTARIPIIMLTAKAEEIDRIVGLELGAEDYVTKPFSPRELTLRVKAILRRQTEQVVSDGPLQAGDIAIDRQRYRATVKDKAIDLTPTEFKLLVTLVESRGRVQQREHLLSQVWHHETETDVRAIDTHIRRLREKLGNAADCIETVRGFGYRFASRTDRPNPMLQPRRNVRKEHVFAALLWATCMSQQGHAQAMTSPRLSTVETQAVRTLLIREYRVQGAHQLKGIEVEEAVYPFLAL
jgi:two-component system phosphate regulon response regulator PhoB